MSYTAIKAMSTLDPVQREVIGAILRDCVNQLTILGGVIPNYADDPSAVDAVSAAGKHS